MNYRFISTNRLMLFISLLLPSLLLSSCSDDKDDFVLDGDPALAVTMDNKAVDAVDFYSLGGSILVKLVTNLPWEITVDDCADWITLSNRSGDPAPDDKPRYIRITAAELTADQSRSGEVVFKAGGLVKTIRVAQRSLADSEKDGLSAMEIASRMGTGVNIGNTLEAPDGEGTWTTHPVNEAYIKGLKQMGFTTVRVPCAWDKRVSDASTNTIDPQWLDRVDEVIGWIVENDMYAILNIHWDGGWLENNTIKPFDEGINKKQHDYWTQIANKLNHYDSHLLFAAMNEPNAEENLAGVAVSNIIKYEQTFIDAVRATGGNNAKRCLVIQAPSTNIGHAANPKYKQNLPMDPVPDKLFMEVHFYSPGDFALMDKDGDWGTLIKYFFGADNLVEGSDRNVTGYGEAEIAAEFESMKANYVNFGIPVILGEYSSAIRDAGEYQAKHEASRAYWNEVVTREARKNGCIPCYWEVGTDINRGDGTAINQYAIDGIMRGVAASQYPF
ncbi:MAG: cellulase family glycosylhydrolase [Muribaculum sp.]